MPSQAKLVCMQIAADLALPVTQNIGKVISVVDPKIGDANTRQVNLEDWEEFRIMYAAVVQAYKDDADWPDPGDPASQAGGLVSALGIAASAAGIAANPASLIPQVIAALTGNQGGGFLKNLLGGGVLPPAASIPNPGVAPAGS